MIINYSVINVSCIFLICPELSARKLLQEVISHVHDVIKAWNRSPPPLVSPPTSLHVCSHAIKNTRRKMEDRHVAITDLNTLYDINVSQMLNFNPMSISHGFSLWKSLIVDTKSGINEAVT